MVQQQLLGRGITDQKVVDAMRKVPRHEFLPHYLRHVAYTDRPLPIGKGQTISQPATVALMVQELTLSNSDRALEIGTGSGYAAAVLAEIAKEVISIERFAAFAERAKNTLRRLNYGNIQVVCGDGSVGWLDGAPYDAIVVSASGPSVPPSLARQLVIGGILLMPVERTIGDQWLVRVTRYACETYEEEDVLPVRFVPLVGRDGWQESGGEFRRFDHLNH